MTRIPYYLMDSVINQTRTKKMTLPDQAEAELPGDIFQGSQTRKVQHRKQSLTKKSSIEDNDKGKDVFPPPCSTSHKFPNEHFEGSDYQSRGRWSGIIRGASGALRMQKNLNNSQPVDHPPREEDIQMNPPEKNPILQQPIVPPQRNNDDPQGIHKKNRAHNNPDPDEQQNPAQVSEISNPANETQRRNSHGQLLDQVNRAVAARNIFPASPGLARSISAFAKCMLGMDKNQSVVIPSPSTPEEHNIFENHKNEIYGAISQYLNNSLDAARQMYGAID
ncbi:hypothetical protein PPACK8108_LOCUS21562 [Phakopsora pachyrhizi]|uniref:Uncharacterized protein n=1 Tax=Phakopsora pachyrhizi TaxID=170000 RepID=A0AAV0BHS7_PHAPC|nr:hypothetical protein PPACK8108_LOCUS21562 [Phakopsora pachyrhizi]